MTITRVTSPVKTRIVQAARPWRPDITRRYQRVAAIKTEVLGFLALASAYANQDDTGPVYLTLHWHTALPPLIADRFRDDILAQVVTYLNSKPVTR